jgi:hypothetical protein
MTAVKLLKLPGIDPSDGAELSPKPSGDCAIDTLANLHPYALRAQR